MQELLNITPAADAAPASPASGTAPGPASGVSRRSFLVTSGGMSVSVVFGGSLAADAMAADAGAPFKPNGWVRIGTDNIITIYSSPAEMGQGVKTSLPLLVAEDMDADWSRVRVEQAPHDPKTFGNPMFGGAMVTGASRTTRGMYDVLRLAGLQAREVIRHSAAGHWKVPVEQVTTGSSTVFHKASGRKLSYGQVAAFAEAPATLPVVTKEQLKKRADFRLIGKDVQRVDVVEKSTGKAVYGIDIDLPGMLYASVVRAPVQGEKPEKVDDAAALKIRGVRKVVTLPYGVGVVADTYWAAKTAREALKIDWSNTSKARGYSTDEIVEQYQARGRKLDDKGVEFTRKGDPESAFKDAAHVVEAEFSNAHVAHTCMEPMNCTAQVNGEALELWAPTQAQTGTAGACAGMGFKPGNIKINTTLLGGGFGRRLEVDFVTDAVLLAKAMPGSPVKVIWSREDDIKNDKFRPLVAQHLTGAVDAQGNIVALRHRLVAESIYARAAPPAFEKAGGKDSPVCEGAEYLAYGIPNHVLYYLREQRSFDVGFWRAVGSGYTKFAIETMMDDLAAAAGKDPLAFRVQNLANQPRAVAVLNAAAKMADWKRARPAGRALGIAYSDSWEGHVVQIAEVSIDQASSRIKVHDVWCAVDPGVAIQPRNIEAQMESAIMYGISAALGEQVTVVKGEPQQSNFHDYPILRMADAPRVKVQVMSTDNKPAGIGEAGLPPIAAAISNGVFKLTKKRLRDMPFTDDRLKSQV